MECPKCGESIPDDSDTCPKCSVRFIRRVHVVERTLAPTLKESLLSTINRRNWTELPMELKIRQTWNSMIILVLVGLVLITVIFLYVASPEWEFRDPEFTYSVIGVMIGVCFGGAFLLMLRKKRLENNLARKKMYVIDKQKISKRKIVRTRSRK
jgi:hypothetical protein